MKKPEIVDGRTQCEVCKKWFRKITKHIAIHDMKVDDYRAMFGYGLGVSLDAEPTYNQLTSAQHKWGKKKLTNVDKRLYQIAKETDIFETEDF